MGLQDFSGGLNTRLVPHLLQPNEAVEFKNIDNSAGSLKPTYLYSTDESSNRYFTWYAANTEWVSEITETSFVEYKDTLYRTQPSSYPTKYDGTNEHRLGIVKPADITESWYTFTTTGNLPSSVYNYRVVWLFLVDSNVSSISKDFSVQLQDAGNDAIIFTLGGATTFGVKYYREYNGEYRYIGTSVYNFTFTDDTLDISGGNLFTTDYPDGILDTYSYFYTYYNSTDGTESIPNIPAITASGMPATDLNILEGVRFIQIGKLINSTDSQVDNKRLYKAGDSLPSYTLVTTLNNTLTTYNDYTLDIDIAGNHILDSYDSKEAPDNIKYLMEAYAMLFGVIDDKLYYSNIAKPNTWPDTNFLDFDGIVTGIGKLQNGLLVFTEFKTFIVTGNSPYTFSKYLISEEQGCESHFTIQEVKGSLIWLSKDGLCASTGGDIQVLTRPKLGKLSLTAVSNSMVHDEVYYLAYDTTLLICDFRYGFSITHQDIPGTIWLGNFKDTMYFCTVTSRYTLGTAAIQSMTYKSKVFDEDYQGIKLYDKLRVNFGPGNSTTVETFINGISVDSTTLYGTAISNYQEISDVFGKVGNNIQFKITGGSEVFEISYDFYTKDTILNSRLFFDTIDFKEPLLINNQLFLLNVKSTTYESDLITDNYNYIKMYENLRIHYIGDVDLTVYTDTETLVYNLSSVTRDTVEIEAFNFKVSKGLRFSIPQSNTGKLYEIGYKSHNRETVMSDKIFFDTSDFKESILVNKQPNVFNIGSVYYTSDLLTDDYNYLKVYENVRVHYKGQISFRIFADSETFSWALNSVDRTSIELESFNFKSFKGIKFGIIKSDTGKVYEIDYKAYNRETIMNTNMFFDTLEFKESVLINKLPILFNILTNDYQSDPITDNYNYLKVYENMRVHYIGNVTLSVITDTETIEYILSSVSRDTIELESFNFKTSNILRFEITKASTGKVYEIDYKAYNRETIMNTGMFFDTVEFKESVLINNQPHLFNILTNSYKSDTVPMSITNHKSLEDIYITYKGDISLDVYINHVKVTTFVLSSTELKTEERKLPSSNMKGYYMSFEYTTNATSKLYAIETPATGRQNG